MITIILSGIVAGVLYLRHNWWMVSNVIDFFIEGLCGFSIGCLMGILIALALPMDKKITIYEKQLETLQDNTSVKGAFFLGCGAFEGGMKYVFYYKSNGGFKMGSVDYDNATIKYSKETKLIEHREELAENWINLFALDSGFKSSYEILVPEGTIKNNFQLDAK